MKQIIMLSVLLSICFTASGQKQELPEFYNKVMLMQSGGSIRKLENVDLSMDIKSKIGKGDIYITADKKTSTVNLLYGYGYTFIVRIETGVDPEDAVELFKAETDKDVRKVLVSHFVMGSSKNISVPKIKYTVSKLETGVYKITPVQELPVGEYIFIVNRPAADLYKGTGGGGNFKGCAFAISQ